MLISAKQIEGTEVHGSDGTLGNVVDVYFDDQHWHVRYLIVDTGSWLRARQVLISAPAVKREESARGDFVTNLTQEQVRNGPNIDTAKPVSRQHEEQLHRHFAWPYYWGGPYVGGGVNPPIGGPAAPTPSAVEASRRPMEGPLGQTIDQRNAAPDAWREPGDDPHLRSMRDVRDYHIQAPDGAIGHVEDFVIDESTWDVRYLQIDTKNWLPGKKVIIPLRNVRKVSWLESTVTVGLPREAIQASPEVDLTRPLTADYTDRLEAHYNRKLA